MFTNLDFASSFLGLILFYVFGGIPRGRKSAGKQVQTFGEIGWPGFLKDALNSVTLWYTVGFRCNGHESKSVE